MSSNISPRTLLENLQWRYATQKFDPRRKISAPVWSALEQALVLTPSSYGLQPWRFFVIEDPKVRELLKAASWGQPQITDASHLVVFAYKKDLGKKEIEHYVQRISQVRGIAADSLAGFQRVLLDFTSKTEKSHMYDWARKQVYLALGNFLTSAALLGVDACPMEGIQPEKYDEILDLPKKGFYAACAAAAGYRCGDDPEANLAKVRFPIEEIIAHV